jgi:hypothetical protein
MWEVRATLPNVNAQTKVIYGDICFKIVLGAGLNNSVEESPSGEASSSAASKKPHFMEHEGLLTCSRNPAGFSYPEPVQSSAFPINQFL